MDEKTLAKDELIGLNVRIKECRDPKWVDKSGIILDETKNTFLLEIENERKRIAKNIAKFEFEKNGRKLLLNGSKITYRSEDRTKKVR
jgi:RNase P/RNase MRP subunit p29